MGGFIRDRAAEWLKGRARGAFCSRGAVLISQDYQSADGADQAFAEFFADRPEPLIALSGHQRLFTKL